MVGKVFLSVVLVSVVVLFGCNSQMESDSVDLLSSFDFESGIQDWQGGISDYPLDSAENLVYLLDYDRVPSSSVLDGNGLNISADNPNGDLFYYFTRKVDGLMPNIVYKLDFEFLVYTQLLTLSKNLSNEDIYLKIGAVNFEPQLKQLTWRDNTQYVSLNVDKGDTNSEGGEDLVNIGSIKRFTSEQAEVISGNTYDFEIFAKSDINGSLWLMIGVDSGIKSELTFGMAALTVFYTKQN